MRAEALRILLDAKVPFLVAGTYAYAHHTGIYRDTKDLDIFIRERDGFEALAAFEQQGWRTERYVHGWLHKAFFKDYLVDLIFSSGNAIVSVDDEWFEHADDAQILGFQCKVPPPEEIFWSKSFILERHRFDGAELNHLLLRAGKNMDWERVLRRFDGFWELLLGHVMLFRFVYPSERDCVPDWVMAELLARTLATVKQGNWQRRVCRGSLTSGINYKIDLDEWGFIDAREEAHLAADEASEPKEH